MVHGENSTVVSWSVKGRKNKHKIPLEVRPLVAFRGFHQLRGSVEDFDTNLQIEGGMVLMRASDLFPPLCLNSNAGAIDPTG